MKYIIYSGANDHYGLREKEEGFPTEYIDVVQNLYIRDAILTNNKGKTGIAFRYAPLDKDEYLISVMYQETTKKEEGFTDTRPGYTAVNFLFTAEEMDKFFNGMFHKKGNEQGEKANITFHEEVEKQIEDANEILRNLNYGFSATSRAFLPAKKDPELKKKRVEAFFAALGVSVEMLENKVKLPCQVYIGYDEETESPEAILEELLQEIPLSVRKAVSFYLGTENPSEFRDVSLLFIDNKKLKSMWKGDGFKGATIDRIVLLGEKFERNSYPSHWKDLGKKECQNFREKLNRILKDVSYDDYIHALKIIFGEEQNFYIRDIDLLTEEWFADLVKEEMFSVAYRESAKKVIAKNKKNGITSYPKVAEAFGIEEPSPEEMRMEEVFKEEKEPEEKGKRSFGKMGKQSGKKASRAEKGDEDVPQTAELYQEEEKSEQGEKKPGAKGKGKKVTRKFLLFLAILFSAFVSLALIIALSIIGISTIKSAHMVTVRLDSNVAFFVCSLIITTLVNIPLGFVLGSMLKEFSKERSSKK